MPGVPDTSAGPSAFNLARRQASVLIIAPAFPPLPGDLSTEIREFCEELVRQGMAVTVAMWEVPGQAFPSLPGIHGVPLARSGEVDGAPAWVVVTRRLVESGLFSACILFANPVDLLPWAILNAAIPKETRLVVRLLLDRSDMARALDDHALRQRLAGLLQRASVTLLMTRTGPDARFVEKEHIPAVYIPRMTRRAAADTNFRERHGVAADAFVICCVGEVGAVKNQPSLVQALRGVDSGWKIIFASPATVPGRPETPFEVKFAADLTRHKQCVWLSDCTENELSAAVAAADAVVCASPYEQAPRELVVAMSCGTPWLAPKECASAVDQAGGIRRPLVDFRETLAALKKRPDLRLRLGSAGQLHWHRYFSPEAVLPAWMELLTSGTTNRASAVFGDPQGTWVELDAEVDAAVRDDRRAFVASFPTRPPGISFCIITDGGEPDKLRLEIESIRAQGLVECEIILGGVVPEGFSDVAVIDMADAARSGRLGYMRNRLVEKSRYDIIVVADDDMLFHDGFAQGILAFPEDYDVLCVRILNTDGTRFWDWAVFGSPTGQHMIDYKASDPFVYVTGGMCVMRSRVPSLVRWSDSLGFYQLEDIDYSRKINEKGLRIRMCERSAVTHNDDRYYGNNYQVGRKVESPQPPGPAG